MFKGLFGFQMKPDSLVNLKHVGLNEDRDIPFLKFCERYNLYLESDGVHIKPIFSKLMSDIMYESKEQNISPNAKGSIKEQNVANSLNFLLEFNFPPNPDLKLCNQFPFLKNTLLENSNYEVPENEILCKKFPRMVEKGCREFAMLTKKEKLEKLTKLNSLKNNEVDMVSFNVKDWEFLFTEYFKPGIIYSLNYNSLSADIIFLPNTNEILMFQIKSGKTKFSKK